jgi:glutathionylspermidine synthase
VTRVVGKIAWRAHQDAAERAEYRFSPDTLRLARASYEANDGASLMRVDLLLGDDGRWSACEINADCPGGHNEALGLPRLARAAGFMRGHNPTVAVEAATERLVALAQGDAVALIYATAYAEDLQVCAILKRSLDARGIPAVLAPPTAPRASGGHLYVGKQRIGVLYRFFPTEWMAGQRNLSDIERAVRTGRVRTISSFAHIFTQSKLAYARAWHHADSLDAADRAVLEAHVPMSLDVANVPVERLVAERERWVIKRAMGRVGDQVFVGALFAVDEWASLVDEALAARAAGEAWLAQRFVRQRTVPTPWGQRYVTLGAYVLEGRFCGYFARLTPETHVSHDALCVPVFVAGEFVAGEKESH